jgi:ubiquinone/menaquinone biosynthesis C-methylase UbiE
VAAKRVNYGIDAPFIAFGFFFGGIALIAASRVIHGLEWPGISFALTGAIMIYGSLWGKLRMRDVVLSAVEGTPQDILDIGCGRGLMLLGAVKKFPGSRGTGIDLWRSVDQANNSKEATRANATQEGVADRVELVDADARAIPYSDNSFDLVLSSHAIHNIPDREGRTKAIHEAMRVLRPGGSLEIVDIFASQLYIGVLSEAGWNPKVQRRFGLFFMPSVWVRARKPTV